MALRRLDDAEQAYAETGQDYDRLIDRGRRGDIYALRKQYDSAAAEYKKALLGAKDGANRSYEIYWLNELTALACATGDLKLANEYNRQALAKASSIKQFDLENYATVYLNAARIARLGQDFAGAQHLLTPLASYRDSDSFLWEYQAELAQLLAATNRTVEAAQLFRQAIDTAESARGKVQNVWYRMTFSARLLDLYRRYVDFLVRHKEPDKALRVAESFHARQLLEKLHSTEKVQLLGDFASVARAQQAVILSYWVGDRQSYLWVTTGKRSQMLPLSDLRGLDLQIRNYRSDIDNLSNLLRDSASSMALYKELIAPAASLIPEGTNVIVIPDGPLADLNFETLISPDKPGHYWLEAVSVRVAPSLMLLHTKEQEKADFPALLLVGGTDPPSEFPALPGSQQEIEGIDHLFHSRSPLVLSGENATPEKFFAADPGHFSLIHLSAHAIAVKENPLDSAIILTPNKQNGNFKVYARQLSSMKLHAELVTLSACRGAGAKAVPGEGLVGLTWAFLSAGAHNVVAGLWDVPDKASAELMEGFYSRLQKGQPPGAALRSAKLEMCSHKAPPYYWAAFQLYAR
jgi:CHAT domain-containing protein